MANHDNLPYGNTNVSVEGIVEVVDKDGAIQALSQFRPADPENAVELFLSRIPALLHWLEENGRMYPWRETKDDWRVFASEILLQRTRANAVEDLYDEFFEKFPSPDQLLDASDSCIEDVVSPLGLAERRTRILKSASSLAVENNGRFPGNLETLKATWGIGDYTARGFLLFARDRPQALVDVNTARVVGRTLGSNPGNQPHKNEEFQRLMETLNPQNPQISRAYNFALIDLGALVCHPETPHCNRCPLSQACAFCASDGHAGVRS